MSRIAIPAVEAATGATAELFGQIRKAVGKVPNAYAALGALNPAGGRCDTLAGWALDGIRAAGEARSGRCRAAAAWGQQWRQGMAPAAQVGDRRGWRCDRRLLRLRCCGTCVLLGPGVSTPLVRGPSHGTLLELGRAEQ